MKEKSACSRGSIPDGNSFPVRYFKRAWIVPNERMACWQQLGKRLITSHKRTYRYLRSPLAICF